MNRRHALSFVNPYSSAVLVLAVAALGLAAALGLSLILKLRSIRNWQSERSRTSAWRSNWNRKSGGKPT